MNDSIKYKDAIKLLCDLTNNSEHKGEIPPTLKSDREFIELYNIWSEIRHGFLSLSLGDLDFRIKGRGYLVGTLKALQSALLHLSWQAKSVAEGDFTQRVDFLGQFSKSFNSMINSLSTLTKELKSSEEKYRLLAEHVSDVIWVFNSNKKRFTYVSPSIYNLRGITVEEAMNETPKQALTPESLKIIDKLILESMNDFLKDPGNPKHFISEVQHPHKNGNLIWGEMSTNFRYNQDGEVEIVGISRNIEKRKETELKVLYLSYNDQLTGLYNRRFYEEHLQKLNIAENLPIALVMADVNGLKLTNDAFGHLEGDALLKSFANILTKSARKGDIIARIGGDEFALLLLNTDSSQAKKIVEHMQSLISKEEKSKIILSVSFGIGIKESILEDWDQVYKQAEDNMYCKKLLESRSMKSETIKMINKSLHENYDNERRHCEALSKLSMKLGKAMGLSSAEVDELGLLGLFHDIGKIGINKEILNKRGNLNEHEMHEMRRHPEIGYQILKSITEFSNIAEYVLAHHERIDGTGYPSGLKGDKIPLQAKILSIVEAYDSMTCECLFKKSLTAEEAVCELWANSGTQFDADIVKVFVEQVLDR